MTLPENFLNRYKLGDSIGSGAMGDVYKGIDTQTGDMIAIKVLNPEPLEKHPSLLERFHRVHGLA